MVKKLFLTFFCSCVLTASVAQNASDFTVTTTGDTTYKLYELLEEGKYVLLDFFFTT